MRLAAFALAALLSTPAWAELPVVANPDHEAVLASTDPQLAANKRLVYDFWREVFEARQLERAAQYLHPDYKQHNPMVAIVAEGDLVMLSFVSERPDPKDKTQKYTTTWFDLFRVQDGRITEHWDSAPKQ